MVQLNIWLPENVKAVAEARAARAGHGSVDAYVESLILADAAEDFSGPSHLDIRSHGHLVELLREGASSPAREMTPADWDELRRKLVERQAAKAV